MIETKVSATDREQWVDPVPAIEVDAAGRMVFAREEEMLAKIAVMGEQLVTIWGKLERLVQEHAAWVKAIDGRVDILEEEILPRPSECDL